MADTTTVELSDEQIDQLLQEAEARLSAQQPDQNGKSLTKPASLDVATCPGTAVAPTSSTSTSVSSKTKAAEELSLRVPEVRKSKKDASTKLDAGRSWYNLPKTNLTPELKRDLQLLKMRSTLDPKRFYKKDSSRNAVPEYSQVGTLVEGPTEFFSSRLTKKERKRTLLEEVLENERETKRFKAKYGEIQAAKTSGKKGHYKKMMQKRYGNKK